MIENRDQVEFGTRRSNFGFVFRFFRQKGGTPKSFSNFCEPNDARSLPKVVQRHPKTPKMVQNDAKIGPQMLQNNEKSTKKSYQNLEGFGKRYLE